MTIENENLAKIMDVINKYFIGNEGFQQSYFIKKRKKTKSFFQKKRKDIIFHNQLRKLVADYEVVYWTNFDLYDDVEFKILLHKNQKILDDDILLLEKLNGRRKDLYVYISLYEKYYYLKYQETFYHDGEYCFLTTVIPNMECMELINRVKIFFNAQGYTQISLSMAIKVIDNLETECKEMGEVTIFDCLFNDVTTL